MTIYVDELFTAKPRTEEAQRFGTQWCHMWTDGSKEELDLFAEKVFDARSPSRKRIVRNWFQHHATLPHYDLTASKRAYALKLGAVFVSTSERLEKARAGIAENPVSKK